MPTLMSDESYRVTQDRFSVIHIRRERADLDNLSPALRGETYGFSATVAEGDEPGEPWPYCEWCVACRDRHYGDYDDPEQSCELS